MDLSPRDFVWPFEDRLPPGDQSIFANYMFGGLDLTKLMTGTDPVTPETAPQPKTSGNVVDRALDWAFGGNKNYMAGGEPVTEPPATAGEHVETVVGDFGGMIGRGAIIILGFIFVAIGLSMFRQPG